MKQATDICFVTVTADAGTFWVEARNTVLGKAIGRLCLSEIGGKSLEGEYFAEIRIEKADTDTKAIISSIEVIL